MTVTYTHEVANARLGGFSNLLLRWKGSVYKLFYKEFIIYISLYTVLSIIYRAVGTPEFRQSFEKLCLQFQSYTDLVPISFVLGFYVSMVVGRWWNQFMYIPWPDRVMVMITSSVHGSDNRGRLIRRTLVRYLNLAQVLTYRSISTAVYKRFPTIQHVIDAGFMTEAEYKQYENIKTEQVKYWVPCVWFANLLSKVRQEGRIYDDMTYQNILKELNDFRGCCGMLFSYDWISIPLVYTQVVTVAVYVFFMSTLLSRQYLDVTKDYPGHEVDLYVPIFTICQFFFYVGWLKVAEQLINPFGEDDDDFEVNSIIDRNWEISMLSVDTMYLSHPKLEKDIYWNTPNPSIPYTAAAASHKTGIFLGSTIDMSVDVYGMSFVPGEMEPPEEQQSESHHIDLNHNVTNASLSEEKNRFLQVPSPKIADCRKAEQANATKKPQSTLAASIRRHFMSRSQDKEREARRALLTMDFLKSRSGENEPKINMRHDEIIVESKEREDGTMSADGDSDDSDSDVGAGSEDDDVKSSVSQRRSSLSSEDGSPDNHNDDDDAPTESLRTLTGGKHSIDESEDRPKAKKPKNSSLVAVFTKESTKVEQKAKRPDKLVPSNATHRAAGNRGRKSPKKKTTVAKFLKRNEFPKGSGGDTEEERRNAQTRTQGLLKISRKKSVQALHRNAKRVNYPGNAWLRHRYCPPWGSAPYFNPTDYTSMTSGAEDHGRHGNDSPFGSMLSFGTSIPSPRPLHFSYNAKRGRNLHFDSASASSCLPSPYAKEDFIVSPLFESHFSPRQDQLWSQPSTSTQGQAASMPYTEDIKRRLLVVNTNTPMSSTAASPVLSRAQIPEATSQYPMFVNMAAEDSEVAEPSDDLLMIAPLNVTGTPSARRENLEAIGENSVVEEGENRDDETMQQTNDESGSREDKSGIAGDKEPTQKCSSKRAANTHVKITKAEKRNICRSKSCSDVPVSKMCETPDPAAGNPTSNAENEKLRQDDDSEAPVPTQAAVPTKTEQRETADCKENVTASVSWEDECKLSPKSSRRKRPHTRSPDVTELPENDNLPESEHVQPADVTDTQPYRIFSEYLTSETTPLLQSHESISTSDEDECSHGQSAVDGDVTDTQQPQTTTVHEKPSTVVQSSEDNSKSQLVGPEENPITVNTITNSTEVLNGPTSADQGYYSAKEDVKDAFSKIRDTGPCPIIKSGCKALSRELLKISDIQNANCTVPSSVPNGISAKTDANMEVPKEASHADVLTTPSRKMALETSVVLQPTCQGQDVILDMI